MNKISTEIYKPSMSWDPNIPGTEVRVRNNPSKRGRTTGKVEKRGAQLVVEIDFGPNEKAFKRYNLLEVVPQNKSHIDHFQDGTFGGPSDLRNILTFEKVKGNLTNVFYSMESSNTDFYAHQFKPVLRFIESPVGRMLLADEVGLGKTIEATYIWKEIQARHSARRLLVVCPAMLREKWQYDLKTRFNIKGEICNAKSLLSRLEEVSKHGFDESFVLISSLEGLRTPSEYENDEKQQVTAQLGRLLDQFKASEDSALIDCTIIDEAHKLRNPTTANNRLGRLLREASHHLVLLTATPVQVNSNNLYQLLRLIDPDEFYDPTVFDTMLDANSSIVKAQRLLWGNTNNHDQVLDAINKAQSSEYFLNDAILNRLKHTTGEKILNQNERIEAIRLLESRSLLSHYMTRSRKREVFPDRVKRNPLVKNVQFNSAEKKLYDHVSEWVRNESAGLTGVSLFAVILRQQQMASSIVGAIESWRDKDAMEEFLIENLDDLGSDSDESVNFDFSSALDKEELSGFEPNSVKIDLAKLERNDTKYSVLIEFLRSNLSENPQQKFVVFAYFRGTLAYLKRRLDADGVSNTLIVGGIGDEKFERIGEFASNEGRSVLLSSEVGSEGIDLQFCNILINYDLPWNPMRVEQRIGRLDRLGQKSKTISIVNLKVEDTIEDRILSRLYERIEIFKESIGDMEDILGELTNKIIYEILIPDLTMEEREQLVEEAALAHLNTQKQTKELEKQAINLIGFTDYILDQITNSRDCGRWLSGEELYNLISDFFATQYRGTKIELEKGNYSAKITLSDRAQDDLADFISKKRPATHTRLHRSHGKPVDVIFDPRKIQMTGVNMEFIDPTHPLIMWIRSRYDEKFDQLHNVVAIKLDSAGENLRKGDYVFSSQRWTFEGIKTDNFLTFKAIHVESQEELNDQDSEELISRAARYGKKFVNVKNVLGDMEPYLNALELAEKKLRLFFDTRTEDFESENYMRCGQQETSARKYADRRIAELEGRILKFRESGRNRLVPMTQGLIDRHKKEFESKLRHIERHREFDPTFSQLTSGIIRIE